METWQYKATQSFKLGHHDKSLKEFKRAIDICKDDRIYHLLDQTIQCEIKLNKLQDALNRSKQMIRNDKQNPKGYIRLGSILKKLGHGKSASKVYEQGLTKSTKSYIGYDKLERLAKENKQVNKKGIDPVMSLPFELIEEILFNLPMKTLAKCLQVSKTWNKMVKHSHVWRSVIDFSRVKPRRVTKKLVATYCQYGLPLQKLVLCNMKPEFEVDIVNVMRRANNIGELNLTIKSAKSLLLLKGMVIDKLILNIPSIQLNLVKLVNDVCIKELTINGDSNYEYDKMGEQDDDDESKEPLLPLELLSLKGYWNQLPKLTNALHTFELDTFRENNNGVLSLIDLSKFKLLENLHIYENNIFNLESIRGNPQFVDIKKGILPVDSLFSVDEPWTNCHTLSLPYFQGDQVMLLRFIKQRGLKNLKKLDIRFAAFVEFDNNSKFIELLCQELVDVEELSVCGCQSFTDKSVDLLSFSNLISLDVRHTAVTFQSIYKLLNRGLKYVGIEGCRLNLEEYNIIKQRAQLIV